MNLEVLVSTMNKNDKKIVEDMNINSDAVIINQCGRVSFEEFDYKGNRIKLINDNKIGIGKSRNMAMLESSSTICVLADDDMIYYNDYRKIIIDEFEKNTDADVIIFNINSLNKERQSNTNTKNFKINKFNYMRYGACRIAFRREKIIKNNIFFSLMFGGGAKYGSGEDTLFLKMCLDKGINIIASNKFIADIKQEDSCWFNGYNEKYFYDKGALIKALYNKYYKLYCFVLAIKWRRLYMGNYKINNIIRIMLKGAQEYL